MNHLLKALIVFLMLISVACGETAPIPTPLPTIAALAQHATATLAPTFTFTPTATPTSTATPLPTYTAYPTLTSYPTYTPLPTATATPIAVPPPTGADWPFTIRRTADIVQRNPVELQAILAGLKAINGEEGTVQKLDLTHDGQEDLLIWYLDPKNPDPAMRGNVLVLTHDGEVWHSIFNAVFTVGNKGGAKLLAARDLNNDRQNELAYTLTTCGANACSTMVRVVIWNGSTFSNLTATDIRQPSISSVNFTDPDGDGVFDMILQGGVLQSVESGPQQERMEIYRWSASGYALSETFSVASDYLPLTVWEANDALDAREYGKAIQLYQKASTDNTLRAWAQGTTEPAIIEAERALLRAFSHYRLIVTHAVQENRPGAEQSLAALQTIYPDSPFRQAGELFMQTWQDSNTLLTACGAVNSFSASNTASIVDPLNNFGYKSPQFSSQMICPLN